MQLYFAIAGSRYSIDSAKPIDLSIPLRFDGPQPNAFHLEPARAHYVDEGGFVGDTRRGGSCNCESVTLNPHGNGTHTECVGHISDERIGVVSALREAMIPAMLISVDVSAATRDGSPIDAKAAQADRVVTRSSIEEAIRRHGDVPVEFFRALVVRTLPNDAAKQTSEYSGANPPYLSLAAMRLVRELGVEHLLVDLPSVDREQDEGLLAAHRIFWEVPRESRRQTEAGRFRTITEMVFAGSDVSDGLYLLNLQIPHFELDAAPSRPLLFAVEPASRSNQDQLA